MNFRPMQDSDYRDWLSLWESYLIFCKTIFNEKQAVLTWRRLCDASFNLYGFVAEKEGVVVGMAHCVFHPSTWTEHDYCYLSDLYVRLDLRNNGIGRTLVSTVVDFAKLRSASSVYWLTQLDNTDAQMLYDKMADKTGFIRYRIQC